MRIAFDLDDTLVPCLSALPTEPRPWYGRLLSRERLRAGTRALMVELRRRGHEPCIYTSSGRSERSVRALFRAHGLTLGLVITGTDHARAGSDGCRACSKHPPSFGIDLLVDNSEGVVLEGLRHGFRVVLVQPFETDWADRVLAQL